MVCKLKMKCFSSFNKIFLSIKVYFYQALSYLFLPKFSANLEFFLYPYNLLSLKFFPCFFVVALFTLWGVSYSILIFAIDIYSFFWHDRQVIFPKLIPFLSATYIQPISQLIYQSIQKWSLGNWKCKKISMYTYTYLCNIHKA